MTDEEAQMLAATAREHARGAPSPERVREMAERALARAPEDMSPDDIRALADKAIGQAWQVTYLLHELAELTAREGQ